MTTIIDNCLLLLYISTIDMVTACSCTVTGIPPRFWQEPQDIVVFGRDAAGGRASLTLNCMTSGVPSPTIAWYRAGTRLSEDFVLTNGSLHIVEITEGRDATRGGVSYHCTANNTFGTIRSRAAIVSYACELRGERKNNTRVCYDVHCAICFRF